MADFSCSSPTSFAPSRSHAFGLMDYIALCRQRRALATMDARQLADIGVTPDQARTEAARPVWDVPSHWQQ
ncbi:DUF1127 domain-containing protein [Thalassobacter stenotrophicus]|uniref:DUF1127 domain-containing protein n=1 Tax=Thalassobacter stenotrophicus TaxID=266809 RepID=UPI0022A95286|nr:DUF1127 domain-containing protein [Thalassobacter stenotrophicus]UYP66582.1 DUF1127 domain-containing protein [Thalassobacter stenotrophicus]